MNIFGSNSVKLIVILVALISLFPIGLAVYHDYTQQNLIVETVNEDNVDWLLIINQHFLYKKIFLDSLFYVR